MHDHELHTFGEQGALQRLAAIVDSSEDAIIAESLAGEIIGWNASAERLFGYAASEAIGTSIGRIIPDGAIDGERGMLARIERGEKIPTFETTRRRKDGSLVEVSVRLSPIVERGRVIGASKVVRDITERKSIEERARRANSYLVSAVDSIEDAFALYDEHDRIVMVNSTFRQAFGGDLAGSVVGRSFEEVLDASLAAGRFELVGQSRAEFRAAWLAHHREPVGAFDVHTSAGRILRVQEHRTPEGGAVSLYVDITVDVAREDELRAARLDADAASASKSEFLASMSHELRTPLNAILGFAELLQRDRKAPLCERHLQRLDHIARGGEHLLRLVDDVLDLSRIESGRVQISTEPVDVGDVVAEVVETLRPLARAREIKLDYEPMELSTVVVADRTRVSQILMNFGSNAIKYGRAGGDAMLSVTRLAVGMIRIALRDNGIGIPVDKQAKIFEPFHRAGQETGPIQGTGIGLAISRRLAAMMGGRVGFSSAPGHGSEFWIELPRHDEPTSPAVQVARCAGESPLAGEGPRHLIVYVEDNPSNIALMRELVDDLPCLEMVTAPSAELGLELIRARLPQAVIMDINLPGMSGIEATRALAAWPETRAIPVIGLSAAALPRDTARAEESGFYRYLTKPVKMDKLTATLEELLLGPAALASRE